MVLCGQRSCGSAHTVKLLQSGTVVTVLDAVPSYQNILRVRVCRSNAGEMLSPISKGK